MKKFDIYIDKDTNTQLPQNITSKQKKISKLLENDILIIETLKKVINPEDILSNT